MKFLVTQENDSKLPQQSWFSTSSDNSAVYEHTLIKNNQTAVTEISQFLVRYLLKIRKYEFHDFYFPFQ